MKRFFHTYMAALIARFTLCAAVPIVLTGVLVYVVLSERILAEEAHEGQRTVAAVATEFADHLDAPRQQLSQVALAISEGLRRPAELDRLLTRTAVVSGFFDAVLLVDAQRHVSHVGLAPQARVVRDDLLGLDLSHQPFWDKAAAENSYWSDAFFSVTGGDLSLAVAVPCEDGRLVGVIGLQSFEKTFHRRLDFMPRGRLMVLDRTGTVIFYHAADLPLARVNLRHLAPVAATLAGQGAQSGQFLWDDESFLGATDTVSATGWVVFYAQSHAEVFAALDQLDWIVAVGVVIGLALALLTAWIIARRIVRDLTWLTRQSEAVALGGYRGGATPDTYVEIARLHHAIATMAEAIDEREGQLRRSSEYYRTLFHGSSDGVFVHTLGDSAELCRFVEVNDVACRQLGLSREALLRLGPGEIFSAESLAPGGYAVLLAGLRNSGSLLFEAVLQGSAGQNLPVEVSAHVVDFGGGAAVLAVARNASERRQTAEMINALYQSTVGITGDEFFSRLAEGLADWLKVDYVAISLLDDDLQYALQLASYAQGELVAPQRYRLEETPCSKVLSETFCYQPRRAQEAYPAIVRLRDLQIEGFFGLLLKARNGEPIGLLNMMSTRELLLPARAMEVLHILAARAAAEIERIAAERSRVRSEVRYRNIFDHASDALFLIGGEGRVRDANQVAGSYLDCPRELLIGMPWAAIETASGRSAASLACQLLEDGALSYEGEFHSGEKNVMPVWIRARLLEIEGEELVLVSARDLSERKAAEAEMAAARHAAEEANVAKSRFLANISHEIRTPMNGVLGMLDLALTSNLDAEQRSWLHMAHSSAEGLMRVINELLDLSRIEAGKLILETASFDLHALVAEAVAPFAVAAEKKGLAFSWRIDDGLQTHRLGDAGRLRQVLVNLLGNAVKFTPAGEVALQVRVAGTALDATQLRFEIRDTGIGIPADKLDRLFRPFSQVDDSMTRRFGGSGLGLAICREIVEAQGGRIGVTSSEGGGSTFFFELVLPLAPAAPEHPGPAQGATDLGPPLHLLIVEDNLINRRLVETFVVKHGWTSRSVVDGMSAIKAWRSEPFDLILMDVQMPLMDGLETTREIRRAEAEAGRGAHVPIIALTAYAMDEDRERCTQAGMDAFLHKPIHFDEFFRICRQLSDGAGGHAADKKG